MVQPQQLLPVRVYQGDRRIMVADPLPGLEPEDISVTVSGDTITIHGARRGPRQGRQGARDLMAAAWATGPSHRHVSLPQPVHSALTNATYGNGVLVLVRPKRAPGPGVPDGGAAIRLDVVGATRGQRVEHTGHELRQTTTLAHRQHLQEAARQAKPPQHRE